MNAILVLLTLLVFGAIGCAAETEAERLRGLLGHNG